ncbi:MAG: protein kinase [Myxococcales bacterium]|nr:protein kinase [Myxococcales bacterium]
MMDKIDEDDPLVGRTLAGRYTLEARIGQGTFGAVYRAQDLRARRAVAVKVFRPSSLVVASMEAELRARFQREARALARLTCRYTVALYDHGHDRDGLIFMVQALLEGRTLEAMLDEQRRLPVPRAVELADQILQALGEAHSLGIVHRDISPGNVMLVAGKDGREEVRVLDFGLAKLLEDPAGSTEMRSTAEVTLGTPPFMAPEQVMHLPVSPATDVYAVGILLFRMVQGRVPFVGANQFAVLRQHVEAEPPPMGMAPEGLQAVVRCALEKDPEARYEHATAMRAALAAFTAGEGAATEAWATVTLPEGATAVDKTAVDKTAIDKTAIDQAAFSPGAIDQTTAMPVYEDDQATVAVAVVDGIDTAMMPSVTTGDTTGHPAGPAAPAPRRGLWFSLAVLALAVAVGIGGGLLWRAMRPSTGSGGTLRLLWTTARGTLAVYPRTRSVAMAAVEAIFEPLAFVGADGRVEGRALTSWTVADDGRSIDLTLRDGAVFHAHPCLPGGNARAAEAADLVWSLRFALRDAAFAAGLELAEVEPVDARTVRAHFTAPVPLAMQQLADVRLLPHELGTCDDARALDPPVGSGAFRVDGPTQGPGLRLVRTTDGVGPDTIDLHALRSPEDALARIARGEADAAYLIEARELLDPTASALDDRFATTGVRLLPYVEPGITARVGILLLGEGPHREARVRRAMALALDRPALAERFPGRLLPTGRFLEARLLGYDARLAELDHDPGTARAEVEAARREAGGKLEPLVIGTLPHLVPLAQRATEQLAVVGLATRLVTLSPENLGRALSERQVDGVLARVADHVIGADPLPAVRFFDRMVQDALGAPDPALGALINQANHTLDRERRAALYAKVEKRMLLLLPYIPIGVLPPDSPHGWLLVGPRAASLADPVTGRAPDDLLTALCRLPLPPD